MGRVNTYLLLEPSILWVNELGDGATFKCFPFMFLVFENMQFLCFKFGLISLYSFIVMLYDKLLRNGVVHFISLIFRK